MKDLIIESKNVVFLNEIEDTFDGIIICYTNTTENKRTYNGYITYNSINDRWEFHDYIDSYVSDTFEESLEELINILNDKIHITGFNVIEFE